MEDNLNLFVNDKEILKGRLSEHDLSLAQLSPSLFQTFVMIVVWTKKIYTKLIPKRHFNVN
jgi:hypothetical protein